MALLREVSQHKRDSDASLHSTGTVEHQPALPFQHHKASYLKGAACDQQAGAVSEQKAVLLLTMFL